MLCVLVVLASQFITGPNAQFVAGPKGQRFDDTVGRLRFTVFGDTDDTGIRITAYDEAKPDVFAYNFKTSGATYEASSQISVPGESPALLFSIANVTHSARTWILLTEWKGSVKEALRVSSPDFSRKDLESKDFDGDGYPEFINLSQPAYRLVHGVRVLDQSRSVVDIYRWSPTTGAFRKLLSRRYEDRLKPLPAHPSRKAANPPSDFSETTAVIRM